MSPRHLLESSYHIHFCYQWLLRCIVYQINTWIKQCVLGFYWKQSCLCFQLFCEQELSSHLSNGWYEIEQFVTNWIFKKLRLLYIRQPFESSTLLNSFMTVESRRRQTLSLLSVIKTFFGDMKLIIGFFDEVLQSFGSFFKLVCLTYYLICLMRQFISPEVYVVYPISKLLTFKIMRHINTC